MPITKAFLNKKLAKLQQVHPRAGDFCFFTDADNLRPILSSGVLLCRNSAQTKVGIKRDCASPAVNGNAPEWVHNCARLYFAPATPFAYVTEGLKRTPDQWPEIPRPVYLVFSPEVLLLPDVKISDGSMGSGQSTVNEADDAWFDSLPFTDIYGRGAYPPGDTVKKNRRHAEVLVPDSIPLALLRKLVFRCEAERDLALHDCGAFPQWVTVEVKVNWFSAPKRLLPHIDRIADGTIHTNYAEEGDILAQISRTAGGGVRAHQCTHDGTKYSDWEPLKVNSTTLAVPPPGFTYYFLNGHRLAVNPCDE